MADEKISFIKFLCDPKYCLYPKTIWGWKLEQKHGGSSAVTNALISSDGYTLQDKNGLNLIPKGSE